MNVNMSSTVPIYIQIAEEIEDLILEGKLLEGEQAPSTNQLSEVYKLNPATARKGLNILVDKNILHKRRGLGMYVSDGAVKQIQMARKEGFLQKFVNELLIESRKLDIDIDEVIMMIKQQNNKIGNAE